MWSHDIGWSNDITSGNVDRAGRLWAVWNNTQGGKALSRPIGPSRHSRSMPRNGPQSLVQMNTMPRFAEGLQWVRDNLPYINFVEYVKYPLVVNKNLKNVPVGGYAIGANFSIVQMYFDN
jgi:hypothetical protein